MKRSECRCPCHAESLSVFHFIPCCELDESVKVGDLNVRSFMPLPFVPEGPRELAIVEAHRVDVVRMIEVQDRLAKMLLANEWAGVEPLSDYGTPGACIAECGGSMSYDGPPKKPHADDCAWLELMKKVGAR